MNDLSPMCLAKLVCLKNEVRAVCCYPKCNVVGLSKFMACDRFGSSEASAGCHWSAWIRSTHACSPFESIHGMRANDPSPPKLNLASALHSMGMSSNRLPLINTQGMKVVGFHFVGPNAGEVTQGFSLALKVRTESCVRFGWLTAICASPPIDLCGQWITPTLLPIPPHTHTHTHPQHERSWARPRRTSTTWSASTPPTPRPLPPWASPRAQGCVYCACVCACALSGKKRDMLSGWLAFLQLLLAHNKCPFFCHAEQQESWLNVGCGGGKCG